MFSFLRNTLLFVSVSSFFATSDATIKNCASGSSIFQITELSLKPDPIVPGEPLDMTLLFINPSSYITDGSVTTTLQLNYVPFSPTTEPLCKNTKCPLINGLNDRSTSSTWPSNIYGKVSSRIEWFDQNGLLMLCIQINTNAISKTNRTMLRGYNSNSSSNISNVFNIESVYSVFRNTMLVNSSFVSNVSSIVSSNVSSKKFNKRSQTLPYLEVFRTYSDLYNTSNNICLLNETPTALVLWNSKTNALLPNSF
jgi:hypothetical protein